MKYFKTLSEYTVKKLLVENLNLEIESVVKKENGFIVEIKSSTYNLNTKLEIKDFETKIISEEKNKELEKQVTTLFKELFTKFFKEKYKKDCDVYSMLKENKFIKDLRNYEIEKIFDSYKVLKITRASKAIEVTFSNNFKKLVSVYITNFNIINAYGRNKIKVQKLQTNYRNYMMKKYGEKYILAFKLQQELDKKTNENMNIK